MLVVDFGILCSVCVEMVSGVSTSIAGVIKIGLTNTKKYFCTVRTSYMGRQRQLKVKYSLEAFPAQS